MVWVKIQMMQIQIEVDIIGFENGGTVNTTSAQLNYLYGASQSSASTDVDTTHSTLYMET